VSCATLMKVALLLAGAAPLSAQEEPVGAVTNRRVMHYLQSLSDADRGKKLTGVRVADGTLLLAGQMLLHRIELRSRRAHVYVLRAGSLTMGMPVAQAWVEPRGKPLSIPSIPEGEPREAAINSGEVYTYSEIHPGDGLVEISCPTEAWIKSLQSASDASSWGIEAMATIDDPDGFTNVRDEDGAVIATVKRGEHFLAIKPFAKAQWEVWLPSGIVGLIHESRVRLLPREPLMRLNFEPCKAAWKRAAAQRDAEAIKDGQKPHPNDYYPTLLRASEGDMAALSRFFARSFEDAPADQYVRDAWAVLHLVGDAPMAEMLTRQPPKGNDVGAMLGEEWTTAPISDGKQYVKRHFPRIYEALYAK